MFKLPIITPNAIIIGLVVEMLMMIVMIAITVMMHEIGYSVKDYCAICVAFALGRRRKDTHCVV